MYKSAIYCVENILLSFFMSVVAGLALSCSAAGAENAVAPLVSWPFEKDLLPAQNSDTKLVPVGGQPKVLDSEPFFGVPGTCLELGGAGAKRMVIENSERFQLGPDFTIEAWVVPKRVDSWNRILLCWGKEAEYSFHFAIHQGKLSCWIAQEDGTLITCEGGAVAPDIPQHLVATGHRNPDEPQKSELAVFLNGKKVGTATFDGTIRHLENEKIGIGDSASAPSSGCAFVGLIDELTLYNKPLSEAAIARRFNDSARSAMVKQLEARRLAAEQERLRAIREKLEHLGVEEIVYAERNPGRDIQRHYYANFGYSCIDENHWLYGADGGALRKLNLKTGERTALVDDPGGGVRDPSVSYDGKTILFSYRKGGTHHYHLYEIGIDGTGLRQLTDGDFDDVESCYLPDGGIAFCSTRCRRYIGCWVAPSAILFRMNADGSGIRQLSSSSFTENTPIVLQDGRILYTRWEYVNRDPVSFHHLWAMCPDGSKTHVYFGNEKPGGVFIDQKRIPGSDRIAFVWSGWHGQNEHAGDVMILDPKGGPNDYSRLQRFTPHGGGGPYRDPCPISEDLMLIAKGNAIVIRDSGGKEDVLVTGARMLHEPVLICPRPRETMISCGPDSPAGQVAKKSSESASVYIANVYQGRSAGVIPRGSVKKLLIMEELPKPANFHGGGSMPIGNGVTSTIKRILGTVPVEPDGSAFFAIPPMRSVYFALLDEDDRSILQMRSYLTAQPGEKIGCIGCHENRTESPTVATTKQLRAFEREISRIAKIDDVPEIIDYPRDVQPIFDRHCVSCHNDTQRQGDISLSGDHGPSFSISYYELYLKWMLRDTNGDPKHGTGRQNGRDRPFTTYSGASPLMNFITPEHYAVRLTQQEKNTIRLWIDTSSPYAGTYSAYGSGQIGGVWKNNDPVRELANDWSTTRGCVEAIQKRCGECHPMGQLPHHVTAMTQTDPHGDYLAWMRPMSRYSRHRLYNLSHPENSLLLLAGLSTEAGGFADAPLPPPEQRKPVAENKSAPPKPIRHPVVFESRDDPDFRTILEHIAQGKERLETIKRFDMPGFVPNVHYLREMKKYGLLPADFDPASDPIDVYELERRYWEMVLTPDVE